MNINSGSTPLVLLCPAWKRWGTATTVKPNTLILHSEQDDVVPSADSEELVRNSGLPESTLIEVGTGHRLADPEPLQAMLEAVEEMGVKAGHLAGKVLKHEVRVPHRFGVGTLLVISTMYAVLFALGRFFEEPPEALVWVALFFSAIGLGQMLLFKGQRPRRASVIVGACVYPCMLFGYIAHELLATGLYVSPAGWSWLLLFLLLCTPEGGVFGYIAELLIAVHFLLIDKLKNLRVRSNDIDPADGART